jgi:hypothetical protein
MAEKIVSPGVFTRENDLSFLPQGIGNIGAAIIGPFKKGPAFLPTVVNTQQEFEEIFGRPDGTYYTGYTVQNYLRETGTVTIVRVGHVGGYSHGAPVGIYASGSTGDVLIGVLHATNSGSISGEEADGFGSVTVDAQASSSLFSISASNLEHSASIDPSDANDINDVFGQSPYGSKTAYAYKYFEYAATVESSQLEVSGSTVTASLLPTQAYATDIQEASTPWVSSQLFGSERYRLFRFHTLGHGTPYNQEYKIAISNVKASTTTANDFATFTVTVRAFSDTDRRPIFKESFAGVNLNPASPNYIAKVIGDLNVTIDSSGKQTITGNYSNNSNYIRVEVAAEDSYPENAAPFGHEAYTNPVYDGSDESRVPVAIFSTGSDDNTSSSSTKFSGIDLETAVVKKQNNSYLAPIPSSATSGGNTAFAFDAAINAIVAGELSTINLGYTMSGSDNTDVNKRQFVVGFQEGFDGVSPTVKINLGGDITGTNSQGFDLNTSTSSGSVAYTKAINSVSNPDDFDINLVSAPGVIRRLHSGVWEDIVSMVEDRQDAFFIGDLTAENDTIAQAINQAAAVDSNYVGSYYPWVKTIDVNTNRLTSVPPSVLMPGVYAGSDRVAAEWYAPAGLNRGGITGAVSVLNRLTHSERDELYEGKVNPIASFPNEGIVAYGQKTLQDAASALDRINVRRLLIKVKKYIASTSRYLVFEQNTATTRNRFLNTVNPYLEGIQQRQGLYAFRVVMDETNNTPDVIDRNILKGEILLQPTRTAEFIVLDFSVLPTGASFES